MSELPPLVLVTGASGFIATHVVAGLLAEKKYRVRGTVRDVNNESSTKPLREAFPDLELFPADLSKDDGWKEAVAGCTYVHHIASPFPLDRPRDPQEVIGPAVEGTRRVLAACVEAGTVKRVVLTSSIAAISSGIAGNEGKPRDHVYTPDDWTDPKSPRCPPYEASKTLAETEARKFVAALEGDKKFELITIHPAAVCGPLITPRVSASHALVVMFLKREVTSVPDINMPYVDVRDVAKAHIAAMTGGTPDQRYILVSDTIPLRDVARVLADEFNRQGYRVPVGKMWKITLWIGKLFDEKAKLFYSYLGSCMKYDNSKVKELGVEFVGFKESVIETAYSLIKNQFVPRMVGFKEPGGGKESNDTAEAKKENEGEIAAEEGQGEKPAEEGQGEKSAEEMQGDKPVDEEQGDKPVDEGQGDKPADEDKPVDEGQGDKPADEGQGDKPADEGQGETPEGGGEEEKKEE